MAGLKAVLCLDIDLEVLRKPGKNTWESSAYILTA